MLARVLAGVAQAGVLVVLTVLFGVALVLALVAVAVRLRRHMGITNGYTEMVVLAALAPARVQAQAPLRV